MNFTGKTKRTGGILRSKILFFILAILLLVIINASIKMFNKSRETKDYLKSVEKEYANLEEQYEKVESDLGYINSKTGIEKEIRSKFDFAKEGERAVLIIEEDLPPELPTAEKNILDKIKSLFSN